MQSIHVRQPAVTILADQFRDLLESLYGLP